MDLRDPDRCPFGCAAPSDLMETRKRHGFVTRKRKCLSCQHRWKTYETIIDPRRINGVRIGRPPTTGSVR